MILLRVYCYGQSTTAETVYGNFTLGPYFQDYGPMINFQGFRDFIGWPATHAKHMGACDYCFRIPGTRLRGPLVIIISAYGSQSFGTITLKPSPSSIAQKEIVRTGISNSGSSLVLLNLHYDLPTIDTPRKFISGSCALVITTLGSFSAASLPPGADLKPYPPSTVDIFASFHNGMLNIDILCSKYGGTRHSGGW